MSEPDRRRDPRAEPDDVERRPVERPFQRELPKLRVDTPPAMPSTSQVRAVITPMPRPSDAPSATMDARASSPPDASLARAASPSSSDSEPPIARAVMVAPHAGSAPAPASASEPPDRGSLRSGAHSLRAPALDTVEHLVDQGQWQTLCEMLGPGERAGTLEPHLALVYALAYSESQPEADASQTIEIAIQSVARAHSLAESSAIARVVAKRLLRKSPTSWRARPAPPKRISIILVVLALTLGGGGGFWLSTTHVRIPLPGLLSH
jgi:hypothetical protein